MKNEKQSITTSGAPTSPVLCVHDHPTNSVMFAKDEMFNNTSYKKMVNPRDMHSPSKNYSSNCYYKQVSIPIIPPYTDCKLYSLGLNSRVYFGSITNKLTIVLKG